MAEISIKQQYVINLTNSELLLVFKSLQGRLKPEEIPLAAELGVSLAKAKAGQIKSFAESAVKLEENIKKAEADRHFSGPGED